MESTPLQENTHFYEVFVTYRFIDSFRNMLTERSLWKNYRKYLGLKLQEEEQKTRSKSVDIKAL